VKRLLLTAAVVGAVGLSTAGCFGGNSEAWRTPRLDEGTIATLSCDHAKQAQTDVADAVKNGAERRKEDLGIADNDVQYKLTLKLNERVESECKKKDEKPPKDKEDEAKATGNDGSEQRLPVVTGAPVIGDSTKEANTPPVAPVAMLQECSGSISWQKLDACVGNRQWYRDGFDLMSPYSGFNQADVKKYATAMGSDGKPFDARLIHVYNWTEAEKPKDQARRDVAALIGNDEVLAKIEVVYHGDPVNSRGLEKEKVNPFIDRKKQVRVSLAPLVYNEKGEVIGLNPNGGVFIDCLNIWGMPFTITPVNQPALCPPGTPMAGQPIPGEGPKGCYPPPPPGGCKEANNCTSTPPGCKEQNNCQPPGCTRPDNCQPPPCVGQCGLDQKNPSQGSNHQGHADQGGGQKANPGPGTVEPPPVVVTTTRNNPPAPTGGNTPPAGATSTSVPPAPTNTGAGTSNSGTVAPPP
jgi:hypothetical protein